MSLSQQIQQQGQQLNGGGAHVLNHTAANGNTSSGNNHVHSNDNTSSTGGNSGQANDQSSGSSPDPNQPVPQRRKKASRA